jgi:hypothetical protein
MACTIPIATMVPPTSTLATPSDGEVWFRRAGGRLGEQQRHQ